MAILCSYAIDIFFVVLLNLGGCIIVFGFTKKEQESLRYMLLLQNSCFFLLQNIEIVMIDCVFRLCFCAEMALLSKCLS